MFDQTSYRGNEGVGYSVRAAGGTGFAEAGAALLRRFNATMRADNAEMMAELVIVVNMPLEQISPAIRPVLIADIRKRHTTMPAGIEISHRMQRYMERALMQARLHLMGDPGARGEFALSVRQYDERLAIRRDLFAAHLGEFATSVQTVTGALEWCERLVTKHTPSEIARPGLKMVAEQLAILAADALEESHVEGVLRATATYLLPEVGLTQNAADRVRRAFASLNGLPDPEAIASDFAYQYRARKLA